MAESRRGSCHRSGFAKNIANFAPCRSVFLLVGQIRATAFLKLCCLVHHGGDATTHCRCHSPSILLLSAGDLLHKESCVCGCVDRLGWRFGHRSNFVVFNLALLGKPAFDNDSLLPNAQILKHFIRYSELFVKVQRELACSVHVWQVFQAAKVVGLLVWHLRKESSPNTLVKLAICDAPADGSESLPMVLAIAHSKTVSTAACISDQ